MNLEEAMAMAGAPLLRRKVEGVGLLQPEQRRLQGDFIITFQGLELIGMRENDFLLGLIGPGEWF